MKSLIEGIADSLGSMKLGVSIEAAVGSPRLCRVYRGVFTLMAMHNRPPHRLQHRHQRHLHRPLLHRPLLRRPLLLNAVLKILVVKSADTVESMKLAAASATAAGSHRLLLLIMVVHTPTACAPMTALLGSSSTPITYQMEMTRPRWRTAFRRASRHAMTFQARIAGCIQGANQGGVASKHLRGSSAIHT